MRGINFEVADNVTKEIVDEFHAEGKVVLAWELNHRALDVHLVAKKMKKSGVDILITNLLEGPMINSFLDS